MLIEKNNDDSTPLKHLATYYESIGDYQNAAVYQQKIVLMKTPEAIILKAKKL